MIYLRLHDRLGNILFMIAAALHLDNDVRVFCSNDKYLKYVSKLIDILQIPVTLENPSAHINHKWKHYQPTIYKPIDCISQGGVVLMDGYFQSYRYFNKAEVFNWFKCPSNIEKEIKNKFGNILSSYETVCVHVRRGDYLKLPERFPFVGKKYIHRAMRLFKNHKVAYIFTSDDIAWCKKNFFGDNIFYSENNTEYFDLFLATKCTHNIMSNSTFSWWGAYLNPNENKIVIAPSRWYGPILSREADESKGELIPTEWYRVKCDWENRIDCIKAYYRYFRCYWRDFVPGLKPSKC